MEIEYFAGYLLQGTKDLVKKSSNNKLWTKVVKELSAFYLSNSNLNSNEPENEHPILTILDNQISRGLPTIPTVFIEDKFSELLGLTKKGSNKIGNTTYNYKDNFIKTADEFLRALAIVDNRLDETANHISFQTWEKHSGSDFEKRFYNDIFNQVFGRCNNQMLELQRSINSILEQSEKEEQATRSQLANLSQKFFEQKTDFVLQFPEVKDFPRGLIIEIDGTQHQTEPDQIQLDNSRDHFTKQKNWETIRIATKEFNSIPQNKKARIENYLNHPYAKCFLKNIKEPLINTEIEKKFLQAMISPFAIARVQKAIVKAFKKGLLDISKEKVSIGLIERDVPCGYLAVEDLQNLINKLSILQIRKESRFPLMDLKVFTTNEYKLCELNKGKQVFLFNQNDDFQNFDMLIDCSVLSTKYFLDPPTNSIPRKTVIIRSLHSKTRQRKFNFYPAITYPDFFDLEENIPENKKESLVFFLQSLFRKESFREGQLEILNKALQKKNPIALLPTGAGKSLTYQLASLLQPGLTIVVDPIKSLMKDQNENLIDASIDSTTYINSSLTPTHREKNTRKFAEGEFLFAFVSPERFIVKSFRQTLSQIANDSKCFSYCVIDEAHCVSEWGHDFRTAYLKLGDNARENCSTNIEDERVSIIGLTGTASFDVLSDVQREVYLIDESSIIRPQKLEREELIFKVKVFNSTLVGARTDKYIRASVAASTHQVLINLLNTDLLDEFNVRTFPDFVKSNGEKTNCGIIFCPHKTNGFGVKQIANLLKTSFPQIRESIGEYYGGGNSRDTVLDETQDKFKSNQISVLVATKAFGMGIDKANIRFTIHITHPISIEGFYQEAGRAGRDREKAVCYILHSENLRMRNGNAVAKEIQESFLSNSFRGAENEKSILFELLDRITYPHTPNINQITSLILNDSGKLCKLGLFPRPPATPQTIYVNGEVFNTLYGQINIGALNYTPSNSIVSIPEAVELLEQIKQVILNRPIGLGVIEWLQSKNETPDEPGIENLLESISDSQVKSITIGFENNGIQMIVDFLQPFSQVFDYSLVLKALYFCFTFNDFATRLNNIYWHRTNQNFNFTQQILTLLKPLYENIRQEQDTFKAVYRLSILEVVKDYIVNYGSSTITLTCQKLSNQQILDHLITYVSRYVTTVAATNVREDVIKRNQSSTLRKCIDYLIDFTYKHIYQKRRIAMDNMEKAVQAAVKDGNIAFATEINNYFDSRYVEELRIQTNNGKDLMFEILFRFIQKVGNNKDEIKQLRGSSNRLLESYQTNALFYWMRLYSSLLLKDRTFSNLQEDFKKGFEYFKVQYALPEIDNTIEQLQKEIEKHDEESLNTFDDIINSELIDITIENVKTINQKILNNYAVPRT